MRREEQQGATRPPACPARQEGRRPSWVLSKPEAQDSKSQAPAEAPRMRADATGSAPSCLSGRRPSDTLPASSLPVVVPADHRERPLSNRPAAVFCTSSLWLQLCLMARVRLWLWSRGCPLYGQGPQQSGRMLSPVVPYSSWARESRMLLAAHLLRAKGGGQGATLSLSSEADWTALAGPGVSQGSWQNRNSLRGARPRGKP